MSAAPVSTGEDRPRRGRTPAPLPPAADAVLSAYRAQLAKATILDEDTRRAYTSRVRGYLA